ncbi:MAG: hypothetical protein M1823_004985 [Watsoniomyces obsoletus]|nr:MAG: hypothetical protein M1823_004985 [Watsoniomyces obsoletus]
MDRPGESAGAEHQPFARRERVSAQDYMGNDDQAMGDNSPTIEQVPLSDRPSAYRSKSHSRHQSYGSVYDGGMRDVHPERRGSLAHSATGQAESGWADGQRDMDPTAQWYDGADDERRPSYPDPHRRWEPDRLGGPPSAPAAMRNDGLSGAREPSGYPRAPMGAAENDAARIDAMAAALDEFTAHVQSMAALNVKHDFAKKEMQRREAEFENSKRHHDIFPVLAEQQANNRAGARNRFKELDQELARRVEMRTQLSRDVAAKLLSPANYKEPASVGRLEIRVKTIGDEVTAVKREVTKVHDLQAKVKTTEESLGRVKETIKSHVSTIAQLRPLVHEMPTLRDRMTTLERSGPVIETTLKPGSHDVTNEDAKLKKQLDELRGEFEELKATSKQLDIDVKKVKTTIHGAPGKETNGVIGTIDHIHKDLKGFARWVDATDIYLERAKADGIARQNLSQQLSAAATPSQEQVNYPEAAGEVENQQPPPVNGEQGVMEGDDPMAATTAMFEEELHETPDGNVAQLHSSLEELKALMVTRDDYIGDEVAQTQRATAAVREELKQFQKRFEYAVKRMAKWKSEVEGSQAAQVAQVAQSIKEAAEAKESAARIAAMENDNQATTTAPAEPPTNGASVDSKSDLREMRAILERQQSEIQANGEAAAALRLIVEHLDSRFNNLSTEQLSQAMLGQLGTIFPHATSIQWSFDRIRDDMKGLLTQISEITKMAEATKEKVDTFMTKASSAVESTADVVMADAGGQTTTVNTTQPAPPAINTPAEPKPEEPASQVEDANNPGVPTSDGTAAAREEIHASKVEVSELRDYVLEVIELSKDTGIQTSQLKKGILLLKQRVDSLGTDTSQLKEQVESQGRDTTQLKKQVESQGRDAKQLKEQVDSMGQEIATELGTLTVEVENVGQFVGYRSTADVTVPNSATTSAGGHQFQANPTTTAAPAPPAVVPTIAPPTFEEGGGAISMIEGIGHGAMTMPGYDSNPAPAASGSMMKKRKRKESGINGSGENGNKGKGNKRKRNKEQERESVVVDEEDEPFPPEQDNEEDEDYVVGNDNDIEDEDGRVDPLAEWAASTKQGGAGVAPTRGVKSAGNVRTTRSTRSTTGGTAGTGGTGNTTTRRARKTGC